MKKKIITFIVLMAAAFGAALLSRLIFLGVHTGKTSVSLTEEHFGTVFTIKLNGLTQKEAEKAISESFLMCEDMEKIFSSHRTDSELSVLNKNALNTPCNVSDELFYLIKSGLYYNSITEGALDISLGNVVSLWGIGTDNANIPDDEALQPYIDMHGCDYIVLDEKAGTVKFTDERVSIDLGAIAKGYAADKVSEFIKSKYPSADGILDFGGNIVTIGKKEGKSKWTIGITDPGNVETIIGTVQIFDTCVVTSGNYQRYFIKDGIRYHHIFDGKTAMPADSGVISATIIGENSLVCDSLSTATYVMGIEKSMKLLEKMDDVEAVFVDESGKIYTTPGIDKYFYSEQ